ncbi:MAG TPA: GNAT family N-acetyltransferase [Candidatus Saccharimonadales bacterium]|nr:GNAT family N-acetyltransferase [Candidatus Saccharimonadales bacterium]
MTSENKSPVAGATVPATSATGPLLLDLRLARRVELAEAQAAAECAETVERLRPGGNAALLRVAGGYAVYCGASSPITQAVALGLDGPVSEEEFDRLENFYRIRGEAVRVETCPLADPSLFERFAERGYRVTEFSNVMARALAKPESGAAAGELPAGLTIERAGPSRIELWTLTVAQGFAEHYPVTEELLEVMRMFALGSHAESYLARFAGKVAGGGALMIRDGVAGLFGASTLPAFRKRGVQTGLLQARLERAAAEGCDLAVSLAQVGSASARNIVRHGFQVLYSRAKFERAQR